MPVRSVMTVFRMNTVRDEDYILPLPVLQSSHLQQAYTSAVKQSISWEASSWFRNPLSPGRAGTRTAQGVEEASRGRRSGPGPPGSQIVDS